ncbi:hypothetical protein GCM10010271_13330 [Streptomyces kurssanovii]|nr:hypothetical protein GCM10010271_13330 [Streptomyces kurssanovii]
MQSAFLKAYQALGRFREGAAFRPWLLRIVANETRNTVRSVVRLRAVAGREALLLGPEPLIPESADPALAAVARERRGALLAALAELTEEQRQVVTYRYLLEMDEAGPAPASGGIDPHDRLVVVDTGPGGRRGPRSSPRSAAAVLPAPP